MKICEFSSRVITGMVPDLSKDEMLNNVSNNIKALRKDKEQTQAQLANALGLSKAVINNYENTISLPSLYNLYLMAKYFEVPIDYFLHECFEKGV